MGSEQNSNHSFNKDFDNGCQGYTGSTKEHRTWSGVGGGVRGGFLEEMVLTRDLKEFVKD